MDFKLVSTFKPNGDQPKAIQKLTQGILENKEHQILLGVTGSGKTFTMANIIEKCNRPTLIIAHNKTLAAQLCHEFKEFFPENAVEYFVSYYDYYQPEAYIPSRDAYIEKEAEINKEIEKLRHSATRSLLLRRDVIIVASVSCIYGLGIPEDYLKAVIIVKKGDIINRAKLLRNLEASHYERNDIQLSQGNYRVKGETIDIYTSWEDAIYRLEFFGDECEELSILHPITCNVISKEKEFKIFPATHYVVHDHKKEAILDIRHELTNQINYFAKSHKLVEAQRIKQRTNYDLEMIEEMGYCKGIENYARHLSRRNPGDAPGVLLDFFPNDFITFIDESHVTIPQIGGMYHGDQSRKQNLVDFGFRLPSAKDNRPLTFDEFSTKSNTCVYVSATPGSYELEKTKLTTPPKESNNKWDLYDCAQQIIRPTGLLDPIIYVRPTKGQIDDILKEINKRISKQERVLITTLTKQMAEDLYAFLNEHSIKCYYIHSGITALDRIDILHNLRSGKIDVLVGVNLLREGLDLPEVSLVVILDADKQGFLRNERSLIQTIGRAARHEEGTVILYADSLSESMSAAINETKRRRTIQINHNKKHNITPKTISKKIADIRSINRKTIKSLEETSQTTSPKDHLSKIKLLQNKMKEAAENLEFELAAVLRDELKKLQKNS